jgi:hypothetical protein
VSFAREGRSLKERFAGEDVGLTLEEVCGIGIERLLAIMD